MVSALTSIKLQVDKRAVVDFGLNILFVHKVKRRFSTKAPGNK